MITSHIEELRRSSHERIDCSQPHTMPEFEVGDIYWQGDIGLLRIDHLPENAKLREGAWNGDLQLAEGNTRGSRHCIPHEYESTTEVYDAPTSDILDGPVLRFGVPTPMTHPEHADHIGYQAGSFFRVRHQQNAARERVID